MGVDAAESRVDGGHGAAARDMNPPSDIPAAAPRLFTPWRIVALMTLAVTAYVMWRGPERFYYESYGTWILSPVIYVRLLPPPLNTWLLTAMHQFPVLVHLVCAAPVALLGLSLGCSVRAIRRDSVGFAVLAFALTLTVFAVYHWLQPFGLTAFF